MKLKTSVVLSGGGARGFAHAGVLKALEENSMEVTAISGVSAGAVIGAFYAAGFPVDEIVSLVKEVEMFRVTDLQLLKPGLFKTDAVRKSLNKHLAGLNFSDLKIPLTVSATDFKTGALNYIAEGDLVEGLLASSAIPALFQPVERNGALLVDGGLMNNFPIDPLLDLPDPITGVHVNPLLSGDITKLNVPRALDRAFHMALSHDVKVKAQRCTWFLEPSELAHYGMFDFENAEEIAAIGYRYAKKKLSDHKALSVP
jgi:NTE family protein